MSYFEYRALYADGRQDNGTLEADSMDQAAANLRQRGLMVVCRRLPIPRILVL